MAAGGSIRVSVPEMQQAERDMRTLASEIAAIRTRLLGINTRLQGAYDGQAARSFDQFARGTAARNLQQVSQMCTETAGGLRTTLTRFQTEDRTLAGVFNAPAGS
ncbi:MAG: WXG100 family type VII secretion target [Promicromonosporaceae bacterium]|nr:WXG100 family type VII secretion target [Promicromonosporaceae bacterium]